MITRSVLLLVALAACCIPLRAQDRCEVTIHPEHRFRFQGYPVHLVEPQVAWVNGEQVMVGEVRISMEDRQRIRMGEDGGFYTGALVDSAGAIRFLPSFSQFPDTMSITFPRVAVAGTDVHAIWGENLTESGHQADSIHHARLVDGRWVDRFALAAGPFYWTQSAQSALVRVGDSLMFAVKDSRIWPRFWVFTYANGQWRSQIVQTPSMPDYLALGALPGLVAVVYAGAYRGTHGVFVVTSRDGGASWSEARALVLDVAASDPQVVALSDTTLAIVWAAGPNAFNSDSVMIALLNREGRTSLAHSIRPPSRFSDLRVAPAPAGFWLLLTGSGGRPPMPYRWRHDRARLVPLVAWEGSTFLGPANIASDRGGRAHVFATQEILTQQGLQLAITRSAVIADSCLPPP